MCYQTVTHPDLDAFKLLVKRWPGIPRAAYEALLDEVGYSIAFTLSGDPGDILVGELPDGTVAKLKTPSAAAWNAFRDDRDVPRAQRLDNLAIAMLVEPTGDAADAMLSRYPAIVLPISDSAVEMVGAQIKFIAKKG
jgi:hypothetical protein